MRVEWKVTWRDVFIARDVTQRDESDHANQIALLESDGVASCLCWVVGWDRIVCNAGMYSTTACVRECKTAVERVCKDVDLGHRERALLNTEQVQAKRKQRQCTTSVMQILLGQSTT